MSLKRRFICRYGLYYLCLTLFSHSAYCELTANVQGLLDFRVIAPSTERTWLDEGFGKTRYGKENYSLQAQLAQSELLILPRYTDWDLSAVLHLQFIPAEFRQFDLIESFIRYKPAPTKGRQWSWQAGFFFPEISLENKSRAWTSPYTITSSAMNSWIGEELRSTGVQVSHKWLQQQSTWRIYGSLFINNDTTGTLLSWRGFSLSDRLAGLKARLPLPPIKSLTAGNIFAHSAKETEPFRELDDRLGYSIAAEYQWWRHNLIRFYYYDNNAKIDVLQEGLYAWRTRFASLGWKWQPWQSTTMILQTLYGNTKMGSRVITTSAVDNDFYSSYILLSYKLAYSWRLSGRYDYFLVDDQDDWRWQDNNNERGQAFTLAISKLWFNKHKGTLEYLHSNARRDALADVGKSKQLRENQLMLSYRYYFN